MPGNIVKIKTVSVIKNYEATVVPVNITLKKNMHLLISGPNGIGKSTFLQDLATGNTERVEISPDARVGYYRQDFSTLDFDRTGFQALSDVMEDGTDEDVFRTAGRFLITAELLRNNVSSFSEGQKGLLLFARLVLQKPNLLILDEPTNHINFRHIPVIAKALDEYAGAMILVSHVPDFVAQIRIDEVLDLGNL
jgi:ATP-binding cassette subfamily F protein 3